jgi:hypothetical protein
LWIPAVVLGGIAALGLLVVGVGGTGAGHDHNDAVPPARRATTSTTAALAPSRVNATAKTIPGVTMEAAKPDRFSAYLPIGGLAPGSVIRVRAQGFDAFEQGRIDQCVTELGRLPACSASLPVQFDELGWADFLFAVSGDFAPDGCRARGPACTLRLTGTRSGHEATQQVVLIDELVVGKVTATPSRGVAEGQSVEVSVMGFPAGAPAIALLCAPPGLYDPRRCSSPAPRSSFVIDGAGMGRTTLVAAATGSCRARQRCAVTVIVGNGFVAAAPAPISFSLGPGVAYDVSRVAPGVAIAVLLVVIALGLAAKTDWTKPTEAATPALDAADLRADQSLDDLFGADAELDARDPIPW